MRSPTATGFYRSKAITSSQSICCNTAVGWESNLRQRIGIRQVMDGKGLFYGLEADATYRTNHLTLSGSYTLSWNKRKYDEFYQDWYYDKYDNRHKLNLSLRYDFNRKVSCFAVWSYHSGNHATVPTQMAALPSLPDKEAIDILAVGGIRHLLSMPSPTT